MPTPAGYVMEIRAGYRSAIGLFSENVFHYIPTATPSNTDPEHLANIFGQAFDAAVTAPLLACIASDVTLTAYQTRLLGPVGGPTISRIINATGTVTGDQLSNAAALCIRLFTAIAKKQGRVFLPGVPESWVLDDVIQSIATAPVGSFMAAFAGPIGDSDTNSWDPIVYTRKTATWHAVTAWAIREIITAMRRRLYPNPYVF